MQKSNLVSPIARRIKEKGPNKFCLVKTRIITKEDMEFLPKWETIKNWYEAIEADPNSESIHMVLQSMVNALVYQERIYFAITRSNVVELFKNDKNWKSKKRGMRCASYKDLLTEMVESGMFEAHPENDRLYAQRKPRIFRLVDETVLSLMKPVSEAEQLKQVFDFVENNSGNEDGNEVGNEDGNEDGNLVLVLEEDIVEDVEEDLEEAKEKRTNETNVNLEQEKVADFEDLLVTGYQKERITFDTIPLLVAKAIKNCHDFAADKKTTRTFEKFLLNIGFGKTKKSKDHLNSLVKSFESQASLQVKEEEAKRKNITWKEPETPVVVNTKKTTVSADEEAENYTLKVLNNSFGKENIKVLKRRLEQVEDENEKLEIRAEIEFWESVV